MPDGRKFWSWENLATYLLHRFLIIPLDDPLEVRRGRIAIILTAIILSAGVINLIHRGTMMFLHPEPFHGENWMLTGLIIRFIALGGVVIGAARQGEVKLASLLLLVSMATSVGGLSLIYGIHGTPQITVVLWLTFLVFSAGLLAGPGWGLLLGLICGLAEAVAVSVFWPEMGSGLIMSLFVFNLTFGLSAWFFAGSLEQTLAAEDHLKQEAATARQLTREIAKLHQDAMARASRELRTPLDLTRAWVDVLGREEENLSPAGREALAMIQRNIHELGSLADKMRQISRLEALRQNPAQETFSLSELLYSLVENFAPLAAYKGLRFRCYLDPRLPDQIRGDPDALRYIIWRLVYNALRFTQEGSISIRVGPEGPDRWSIYISNSGPGFRKKFQHRIFEPFFRLRPPGVWAQGGPGLGLTLVRELVRTMEGEINLESEPGQSTTFVVTLPLLNGHHAS